MNLIDDYLKANHYSSIDELNKKRDNTNDENEFKLKYFYNIFIQMDKNKCDDIKRLEKRHKQELTQVSFQIISKHNSNYCIKTLFFKLEDYIHQVKTLTEEREKLVSQFSEENLELKNKIKSLHEKSDCDEQSQSKTESEGELIIKI
jgi:hypothetical protein